MSVFNENHVFLGKNKNNGDVKISLKALQRHFACFGSSGSGKTVASKVLIEELAIRGVPVIAIDPQGDIASLALSGNIELINKKGVSTTTYKKFSENVEVVIWTPGSSKGVQISLNPLQFDFDKNLPDDERNRLLFSVSKNISSLIGYNLEADDGKSAEAVLSTIFEYCSINDIELTNFNDLINILNDLPTPISSTIKAIVTKPFLKELIKKISLMKFGTKKLIFQTGVPANMDALLGKDKSTDKTRISIIYLNTLHSSEEKEFFISGIAQLIYTWMLKNPLKIAQNQLQCALFIDEVAPYIPPVKVPSCKESLELLFRQGRKYGVSCIIASQSPSDVDYKSLGQFSTLILGTLYTKQDLEKVKKRLKSIANNQTDYILDRLPALKKGQFLMISPDEVNSVIELKTRWLVTEHRVLSENELSNTISKETKEFYVQNNEKENKKIKSKEKVLNRPFFRSNEKKEDQINVINNNIYARDLEKHIDKYLEGIIFKSERLENFSFTYFPLIKVNLSIIQERGIFTKTVKKIPENLYLHYKTYAIFHYKNKEFKFDPIIDKNPQDIKDIDDYCTSNYQDKSDIDFDFRSLGGLKIDQKKIKRDMERKYKVCVNFSEIILFPIWNITIKDKKKNTSRIITVDGIMGNKTQNIFSNKFTSNV
jgi:hypothetical protein